MFDFRDMRPLWEIDDRLRTREDLSRLGCSNELIDWLQPHGVDGVMMVEPAQWFWRDKDWYDDSSSAAVREIHEISGGTFCQLPLTEQCVFLGLDLQEIKASKVKGARGKWHGKHGPVSIENIALERYHENGWSGFAFEGAAYNAWIGIMNAFYRTMFKRIPGYEKENGQQVLAKPSRASAADYLTALRAARENFDAAYTLKTAKYDKLWAPATYSTIKSFTDMIGWDLIEKMHDLQYRLGATVGFGWPDLTVGANGSLRFVEVKGTDRLRGNQALWVRDVARPLGLNVSVVRVVED